ncbi:MAG: methionine biosynthesis protein MetW [candidate division KSB1 bacterium]|nr:methionine biosynthesis protein MetW [candidate division KSB1 bacterium]MDZ7345612.1 methionine biosynthesis protein MetW [candidate division KSB1 bacterium]
MPHHRTFYSRVDLETIFELIEPHSSVLDLGCGDGELLLKLMKEKQIDAHGVEINADLVSECIAKGIPTLHSDLNAGLGDFPDNSFDYVVLSQTLQQIRRPDYILADLLRVGRRGIVGLINFGYWKVRGYLLLRGAMPKSPALPYEWYDTPNIHLSTLKDFERLCRQLNIRLAKQINIANRKRGQLLPNLRPNLFAELAVFVIERG